MTLTRIALAVILPLALTAPAFAQNVTVTTGNGGTMSKNRDCVRGTGSANCSTTTAATTAGGQTVSKTHDRTTDASGTSTTVQSTGPNGQSNERSRKVVVSR